MNLHSSGTVNVPMIVVFDSGLGGLTVFREVARARPDARFVYLADDLGFPYGRWRHEDLVQHIVEVIGPPIARHAPDLVVIACNTASTLALAALRARYAVPFVGTVPAIKPACAASSSRLVSVLGTQATVAHEYTRGLIDEFAQGCEVTLVGAPLLACHAEQELQGEPADDDAIAAEIAPCFVEKAGRRTDTVVLACTHYPLLRGRIERLAPWPVTLIDPAPAIARRVLGLLGPAPAGASGPVGQMEFTSGALPSPALLSACTGFGLTVDTVAV